MKKFNLQIILAGALEAITFECRASDLSSAVDQALKTHPRCRVQDLLNRPLIESDIETLGYSVFEDSDLPDFAGSPDFWYFRRPDGEVGNDPHPSKCDAIQAAFDDYVHDRDSYPGIQSLTGQLTITFKWFNAADASKPIPDDHIEQLEERFYELVNEAGKDLAGINLFAYQMREVVFEQSDESDDYDGIEYVGEFVAVRTPAHN